MKFQFGDKYIIDCYDLITDVYYRWHLHFVPSNKAYRIIDEDIYIGQDFRYCYYILDIKNMGKKKEDKQTENFSNNIEKDNFWSTCPVCGDYLGEGVCSTCHGFDWDSYQDSD